MSRIILFRPHFPAKNILKSPQYHHVHRKNASLSPKTHARMERIIQRLPKFLRQHVSGLRAAPVTHIVSFMLLHELTALIPLLGLSLSFHYSGWSPQIWDEGKCINEGLKKFERYFTRKRLFGFHPSEEHSDGNAQGILNNNQNGTKDSARVKEVGLAGKKILFQVATAYAITKVLLPVRIALSLWGTPWFAMVLGGRFKRLFGKN
ncbi:hypothetical protein GcM1_250195 [Golovinomyces cichoracearum]|uniref:Uncharacterized protein n=1 Tax=Golovinomyces cichoracearum TaxID=62708 RepID=A0A420IB44_9PEZI|nr:hypothetical protein GcM1_250195 [Golovinomyces cichoracearum]